MIFNTKDMNKGLTGGRLANAHSFQCDSIAGMEVERFVGFHDGDEPNGITLLAIKLKGKKLWQCFFLDAGLGFWQEQDEFNTFVDWEDSQSIDLAKCYSLTNQSIKNITCNGSGEVFSSIIFEIGNNKLLLKYMDTTDIDSETFLEKV
jgi:hypothetical protein